MMGRLVVGAVSLVRAVRPVKVVMLLWRREVMRGRYVAVVIGKEVV